MIFGYMRLPALFGIGRYTGDRGAAASGRAVPAGNVTYRGTEVGTVKSVNLTDTGVAAVLSLTSTSRSPPIWKPRCTASPRSVSSTSRCCPAVVRAGAEGRRRDPAGSHQGSDRYQHGIGDSPTAAWRRSRATTSRPPSTRPISRSADWARSCPGSSRAQPRWPSTPARTWTR